jgi:hypothetical protein
VNALGQPFVIQISHPGLRARILIANGNTAAARSLAERGVLSSLLTKDFLLILMSTSCVPDPKPTRTLNLPNREPVIMRTRKPLLGFPGLPPATVTQ